MDENRINELKVLLNNIHWYHKMGRAAASEEGKIAYDNHEAILNRMYEASQQQDSSDAIETATVYFCPKCDSFYSSIRDAEKCCG